MKIKTAKVERKEAELEVRTLKEQLIRSNPINRVQLTHTFTGTANRDLTR
jgi:hypothetical protein